jgi:T5SS/PEP-CTERM-associated repeat protein
MKFMRRLTLTRLGAAEQTAGMVSAASILARRVAFPLLLLGAGRFSLWAALWFLSVSARADVLVWTNENGGAFSDNNNWSNANGLIGDHRVPGGGDTACIGAGASDGQNDGCGNGPILKGMITVDSGGVDHLFTNTVQLSLAGTLSANTASLGTAQISGNGTLSAGTLDSGFTMVSGGATLKSSGMATMSFFTVSGGGTANTNSTALDGGPILIDGGSWTTGMLTDPFSADVTVSGSGQLISSGADILQNSTFTIDGGGSLWSIAGSLTVANGQFTMKNGGRITSGDVFLGTAAASNAQVTIDGATSSWGFGGKLYLGYAGNSNAYMTLKNGAVLPLEHDTFIGEGGFGSLVINSGSQVQVSGGTGVIFGVGDLAGSQGGVIVNGQNSLLKLITAGVGGEGGSGGISVSGGGTLISELMELGLAPGGQGTISISGGGSSWTNIDNTVIGRQGTGTFTVDSGGLFVASSAFGGASFILGQQNGSSGSAGVSDAGSLIDLRKVKFVMGSLPGSNGSISAQSQGVLALGPDTVIGDAGTGALYIYFGGQVTFTQTDAVNLTLGNTSGSSGTMVVNGSSFADSLPIIIGKAGAGSFSAMNHSTVQMFGFNAAYSDSGQGSVTVDNSSWVNSGNVYVGGLLGADPASTVTVQNNATMRVAQRMTVFKAGSVSIDSSSKIAVGSGDFGPPGSLRVSSGGILGGFGRVHGQVIEAQGGFIWPGNSPGLFTIDGSYEQDDGGTFEAEIGGTDPGNGYDQIQVTGAAVLGGNLNVRLINGFTPAVGQTFRIVNAASVSGAFASISEPSQAGINLTSDATGVTVTITSVVAGAPVISSATTANAAPGAAFSYQITATNNPTSFGATNLPTGLMVNNSTGLISGTPANPGAFIVPINANNAAGSGQADLTIVIDPIFGVSALPPSNLLNISTRMRVLTGDQVLIGGFIVTGTDPKKVIIRGMGPSLNVNGTPIPGRLADPTLELHQPDGTVITNDNWKINDQTGQSQEADIRATTIPPTSDLESALIATLPPGNYTAILAGKNGGTGVGLVEVYDLAQGANSKLANISTRGFVDTGDNVMIGGLIVGGTGGGAAKVIVRALGPSVPVAGALGDPTLELHDQSGTTIATNDNWKINDQTGQSQETDIRATTIPPPNDLESALIATLAPGNYTAIVRGKNNTTGVGLVEVYNLQ